MTSNTYTGIADVLFGAGLALALASLAGFGPVYALSVPAVALVIASALVAWLGRRSRTRDLRARAADLDQAARVLDGEKP